VKLLLLSVQDLSTHVADYKTTILEGKKSLLVAHSPGNFFANQAFGSLSGLEQRSFGIVAVANPDSFVATGVHIPPLFEDLSFSSDYFGKNRIGIAKQYRKRPNVTKFLTLADLTGHFFRWSLSCTHSNSKVQDS